MSKSNTTENDALKANLKGTDPAWRSNANRWIALYTSDPGEAGTAVTNETVYTNYARVIVAIADWTDGGSTFTNATLLQFLACGVTGATITHVAVVTTASGAGQILYSGALNAPLTVSSLIQPQFAIGALSVSED
mgnify:FL=1